MSEIEQAYEVYKNSTKIKVINGTTYFRIAYKESFNLTGRGKVISAVLPRTLFEEGKKTNRFIDENGEKFEIGMPSHYSFRGDIPEWYKNAVPVFIFEFEDANGIGEFISPV